MFGIATQKMSDTAQVYVVATVKESSASYRETGPKIMDSVEVDATVRDSGSAAAAVVLKFF